MAKPVRSLQDVFRTREKMFVSVIQTSNQQTVEIEYQYQHFYVFVVYTQEFQSRSEASIASQYISILTGANLTIDIRCKERQEHYYRSLFGQAYRAFLARLDSLQISEGQVADISWVPVNGPTECWLPQPRLGYFTIEYAAIILGSQQLLITCTY